MWSQPSSNRVCCSESSVRTAGCQYGEQAPYGSGLLDGGAITLSCRAMPLLPAARQCGRIASWPWPFWSERRTQPLLHRWNPAAKRAVGARLGVFHHATPALSAQSEPGTSASGRPHRNPEPETRWSFVPCGAPGIPLLTVSGSRTIMTDSQSPRA